MSDSTVVDASAAAPLPQVSVERVIEITIRSNVPNIGKTVIASRLMRVLKSEFQVSHAFTDNADDDIQEATYLLNTQGPPSLAGVTVLIVDDNQPIAEKTLKTLREDAPAVVNNFLRALPPIDPVGTPHDTSAVPDSTATAVAGP